MTTPTGLLQREFGDTLQRLLVETMRDGDERAVTFYNTGDGWVAGEILEGEDSSVRGTNAPVNTEHTISIHTHPPKYSHEFSWRDYRNFAREHLAGSGFGEASMPAVEGYGVLGWSPTGPRLTIRSPTPAWYKAGLLERSRARNVLDEESPGRPDSFVPAPVDEAMSEYVTVDVVDLSSVSPPNMDETVPEASRAPTGGGERRPDGKNPLTRRTAAPETEADGRDLFRVGLPRITEAWVRSFTANRGSGGLGTGVYAYTAKMAAEDDVQQAMQGDFGATDLFELRGALDNPLLLSGSGDAFKEVRRLHDFAGLLSLIARRERDDPGYIDNFPADYEETAGLSHRSADWVNEPDTSGMFTTEDPVTDIHNEVFRMTLTIGSQAFGDGLNEQPVYEAALMSCREAVGQRGDPLSETWLQPINFFLWPQFDGVYPLGEAGRSNKWGACIFKQKIDECLGRDVQVNEDLPVEKLNKCFRSDIP